MRENYNYTLKNTHTLSSLLIDTVHSTQYLIPAGLYIYIYIYIYISGIPGYTKYIYTTPHTT